MTPKQRKEQEELDRLEMAAQNQFNKEVMNQAITQAAEEKVKQRTVASISDDVYRNESKVAEVIRHDDAIPDAVKDDLMIASTNPKAVQESAKRNLNTRDAQQSNGSIKSQFLDALTFFGPQIIGGLFGAAEGDAGMLAGAEMGGKLRDSYLDYQFQKQDREIAQQRQLGDPRQQIISQPFRIKDGSGWAFPTKSFDPVAGQAVVKFYREDGTEIDSSMVEEPQDTRTKAYLPFKEKQISQGQVRLVEQSAQNFITNKTISKEQEKLQNIMELEDLVNSNTKITGLIDFKMAKGIAGEVGNLAESERKAAAQIVGYRGALANLEEWLTSNLSNVRREEIMKLVDYIKPQTKKRIINKARNYAKNRAGKYNMDESQYTQFLLDSTGFDLDASSVSDSSDGNDRAKSVLERIRKIKAGRK